jgi:hypothetical protein
MEVMEVREEETRGLLDVQVEKDHRVLPMQEAMVVVEEEEYRGGRLLQSVVVTIMETKQHH